MVTKRGSTCRTVLGWFVVLVLLLAIHAAKVYDSFFEKRDALLYHPETDTFFVLQLEPVLMDYKPWLYALPFKDFDFHRVWGAECQGTLADVEAKLGAYLALEEQDADAAFEMWRQHTLQQFDELERGPHWVVDYWVRTDLEPASLIPPQWDEVARFAGKGRELLSVDALAVERMPDGSIDARLLHGALLVYGEAAYVLEDWRYWGSGSGRWPSGREAGHQ